MIKLKHFWCYSVLYGLIPINNTSQVTNQNEKITIGDEFDTSIFDTAKTIKNFISVSYGLGMNDARVTTNKWIWSKTFTNTAINKQILNNIRTHKHKFFWNNKCFNFTLAYNIVLSKHFVFLWFLKFVSQNYLFCDDEVSYSEVVSVYKQKKALENMRNQASSMVSNAAQKKQLEQKMFNTNKQQQIYNACIEDYLNANVSFLLIKNFGIGVSFAWYSNMKNLAKSWFVKFPLLHAAKQWCSELSIYTKNVDGGSIGRSIISYNPQAFSVRTNSIIIMAGIEIGYAHWSAEFFINLTPTFNSNLTYVANEETEAISKINKNLYCFGFVLKYNHC